MLPVGLMPIALPWERARLQRFLIYNLPQRPFPSAPSKTPLVLHDPLPHDANTNCHHMERDMYVGLWLALMPGLGAPCSRARWRAAMEAIRRDLGIQMNEWG